MVAEESLSDGNASFLRAARAGNLEKVLEYLKGSIDINTSNANGLNALHLASKEGHVDVVTELVKRGANVNAATKKGNTALHIASLAGQEEVVKILVRNAANVNVQSQNGFTPLYMASQENHDSVVRFLLANGANQSLATEDGFTPLAVALQQGHDKVVAVLLENDAKGRIRLPALHIAAKKDDCKAAALLLQNDHDPDVTSKSGFTPLHIAAHYGNENIAKLLLEKSADVNYAAKHQITPLHVAAKWGKTNMVILLLEKGAKLDASTRDGLTPLHCAARSGHDQVVDLLLDRGAPITAKTKNGLAPLHMASQGDHVDSARILLYHKAPVDDVTVDYLTALHVAAHCGHVRVAKLLLDRKADPNARALNGFTPLHIACKKNRIKVIELLLKHGASIEATTESGLTPLHVASFMGCMNIVIYLIQHGANPDVPTVRGETPLHLAARANQSDIIRILLRNDAHVDACAREQQTPLHIAARLGNGDIVGLLLQHGAAVDATTKDMYTALHIAAKEGQEEVASVLLDQGASLTSTTKKGFTPLHLAAKYGNIKVARLLLQKDAPVDAQGKNGVTPLHVASHYDHVNVALLLLDKGASPHASAKNGYTPLHIAAKKNQMDIATTLLEYGAKPNAESKAGFTPLHLAAQEGHTDMTTLLIEHHADVNAKAKNGLTSLHLCSQEDCVNVAAILVKNGADVGSQTKAGYTPLHVSCHFGQINMIRFLLQHGADVNATTSHGYTPLHQAAQQGHTLIINLLLEHKASPNTITNQGQTALSIAQRLGYISVVETLKIVTETVVTTTTTTITEEKYKVVAPETMQETFMSDSEDEGGEDTMLGDQSFRYLTADEMKSLGDDSLPIDVTKDERGVDSMLLAPLTAEEEHLTPQHAAQNVEAVFPGNYPPDNIDISRAPVHVGKLKWKTFLVSFMVDARGGAMRGCRHSGVRVIIPPRKAPMPMRITCRYLRKEKLAHPPPLMEGEACASRILEVGPVGAKFLGPVIIEVPHFASLRGREREITILRSDNGESWREHTLEASEEAVHDVLNESFDGEEVNALEDLNTNRITRILTTDFPQYFAIITRIRQEVHAIGPEGGMVSSTVVPQVQAIFPEGALTKKIKVGLQAHPIPPELVTKLLGNRVAVSPIVTVEPRRRKFHKPITLTIPVPQAATKGMINQYSGDAPTLRLLCSITGGTTKAQWEDVTGSTPLTFVNDCVSFTTTVSARFWLMDCRQVNEATKFATELYRDAIHVPFMAKFVVFAKRYDPLEAQLRVFCMTDDKEDKTLENQEHFTEVAKSRDVEVLEAKCQYLEFAGNLVPVTKSGEQLSLTFQAFRENRLPFVIRVKDTHQEPLGRIAFMREQRVGRGEPPQTPICNLNISLPEVCKSDTTPVSELVTLKKNYVFVEETGLAKPELIHRADLRLSDIARELHADWVGLALQLDIPESDINSIKSECPEDLNQQALVMLRLWMQRSGNKATGNTLEKGLRKINREDIVNHCMFNVELVTDDVEKAVAKVHLDQSGFDAFKEELGPSRDASLRRETSLDASYDEQDIMKEAESAAETSSEGSVGDKEHRAELREAGRRYPASMMEVQEEEPQNPQGRDIYYNKEDKSKAEILAEEETENELKLLAENFCLSVHDGGNTHFESKQKCFEPDEMQISNKLSKMPFSESEWEENLFITNNENNELIFAEDMVAQKSLPNEMFQISTQHSDSIVEGDIAPPITSRAKMYSNSPQLEYDLNARFSQEPFEETTWSTDAAVTDVMTEKHVLGEHFPHVVTGGKYSIPSDHYFDVDPKYIHDEAVYKGTSPLLGEHCEPSPWEHSKFALVGQHDASETLLQPCDTDVLLNPLSHHITPDVDFYEEEHSPECTDASDILKKVTELETSEGSSSNSNIYRNNDDILDKDTIRKEWIDTFETGAGSSFEAREERMIKETKTPPPSPAEKETKASKPVEDVVTTTTSEVLDNGTVRHTVKTVTKTTVIPDLDAVPPEDREQIIRRLESETWPSGEIDTSQVSVSSLPEDEKSEPTTATVSSGTAADPEASNTEDQPFIKMHTEQKEWTEKDDSGAVHHVVQTTTSTSIKDENGVTSSSGVPPTQLAGVPQREERMGSEQLPDDSLGMKRMDSDDDLSVEETLTFAEKRNFFQRLSLTSQLSTPSKSPFQEVSLHDLPMAEGEIVNEQISFAERLQMFEPNKDCARRKTEKLKADHSSSEQFFICNGEKQVSPAVEQLVTTLEATEIIVKKVNEELQNEEWLLGKMAEKENVKFNPKEQTLSTSTLAEVEEEVSSLLAEVNKEVDNISEDDSIPLGVNDIKNDTQPGDMIMYSQFKKEPATGLNKPDGISFFLPDDKAENEIMASEGNVTGGTKQNFLTEYVQDLNDRNSELVYNACVPGNAIDAFNSIQESKLHEDYAQVTLQQSHQKTPLITNSEDDGDDADETSFDSRTTTTTRVITTSVTTNEVDNTNNVDQRDTLRQSMEEILDQFMNEGEGHPKDSVNQEAQ